MVGSNNLLIVAVGVVDYCLLLYRSSSMICTLLSLLGGIFIVFLLLEIWLEDSCPRRLLNGRYLFIGCCGPRVDPS